MPPAPHACRLRALAAALGLALSAAPARAELPGTRADWPCKGCVTRLDPKAPATPRPLVVALHGDGGGVRALFNALRAAADEAGAVVLAPRCPVDLGCPAGSFWQWQRDGRHDPAWLGAQIDAVTAAYPIDPDRVVAVGYSGGATYLGFYGPTHAARFAAIAHVAGGLPYPVACPAIKVPVLFFIGATDPMIVPYTRPLYEFYRACGGHEAVWEQLPGVTHEGILPVLQAGQARHVLGWLLARPAPSSASPAGAARLPLEPPPVVRPAPTPP